MTTKSFQVLFHVKLRVLRADETGLQLYFACFITEWCGFMRDVSKCSWNLWSSFNTWWFCSHFQEQSRVWTSAVKGKLWQEGMIELFLLGILDRPPTVRFYICFVVEHCLLVLITCWYLIEYNWSMWKGSFILECSFISLKSVASKLLYHK